MDTFASMSELLRSIPPPENYAIYAEESRRSRIKVFAPHGGCIEPATEPITFGVAGETLDYFVFSGKKKKACYRTLHVTSTRYDEPQCLRMAEESYVAIAFHGSESPGEHVFVGGGNEELREELVRHLKGSDYPSKPSPPHMRGEDANNFINRARNKGIQIELSSGFRKTLFPAFPRCSQRDEARLRRFCETMRAWIATVDRNLSSGEVS